MIDIDTIYNEDCLEGMKRIPDKSIDCIICDLPYGKTSCKWDVIIPFDSLWLEYKRIRKPETPIILFGSEPFSSLLRLSNLDEYKYDWVWKKGERTSNFYDANRRPLLNHEIISVFYKQLGTYNPQMVQGKPNHNNAYGTKALTKKLYGNVKKLVGNASDMKFPKSIIVFDREYGKNINLHPTQKPVDLIRYLVRTYTNEGDLVLDNCMGSGTTAIACIKEKRHFIGFELDKEYFDIAEQRIEKERKSEEENLF